MTKILSAREALEIVEEDKNQAVDQVKKALSTVASSRDQHLESYNKALSDGDGYYVIRVCNLDNLKNGDLINTRELNDPAIISGLLDKCAEAVEKPLAIRVEIENPYSWDDESFDTHLCLYVAYNQKGIYQMNKKIDGPLKAFVKKIFQKL